MKLEVLMAAMNQKDFHLVEKANIQSDAIIINQSDEFDYSTYEYNNHTIKMYSFAERGIGKSRNKALMASDADICLLADDDVKYKENYSEIVLKEFEKYPEADVIIFDFNILEEDGYRSYHNQNKKINYLNFMKHGGPKIAFRRESIVRENIFFSLLFGGGAKYGSGEDTIFLKECLDANLKIIETDKNIGEIDNRESSWFEGHTIQYFYDKGALYKMLFPRMWPFMCTQHMIRHHRQEESFWVRLREMFKGAQDF